MAEAGTAVRVSVSVQSSRDRLLGVSAITFASSAVLFMASDLLVFIDSLQNHALVGYSVGLGFAPVSPLLGIVALSLAAAAFLLARSRRASRLGTAASVLAAGFTIGVVGDVIVASVAGTHDSVNKVTAALAAQAAGDLALAVAAALAAVGFFASVAGDSRVLPRREGLLGWGSVSIAAAFAFRTTSAILLLVFYSDLGARGSYTTGFGVAAAGLGVSAVAGAVAAAAFFISRWRQRRDQTAWMAGRDVTLGVGTAIFTLGFLVVAIGLVVLATSDPENGVKGKQAASDWLSAIAYFGLTLTAACPAIGFFLSRSKRTV